MKLDRILPSQDACTEMGVFNIAFHVEHGFLPLNAEKGMKAIIDAANAGLAFFARNVHGVPVASMGLRVVEYEHYSDQLVIANTWLHVRPDRYESAAFKVLLRAAKEEAVARSLPLILSRSYRRTEIGGAFGRVAESIGFVPVGHDTLMRLPPARGG